jgi:hypothetical protein
MPAGLETTAPLKVTVGFGVVERGMVPKSKTTAWKAVLETLTVVVAVPRTAPSNVPTFAVSETW